MYKINKPKKKKSETYSDCDSIVMEKQRGVGASELTGRHCYSALIHSKTFKFFKQKKKTSSKLLFQKLKTIKKIKSERERERGKTLKKRQR